MEKLQALKNWLQRTKNHHPEIKKLAGSSLTEVFFCGGKIYKIGALKTINDELNAYRRLRREMPDSVYNEVFPKILTKQKRDYLAILEIESAGEMNLEDFTFSLTEHDTKRLNKLSNLNNDVLNKIRAVFNSTKKQPEKSERMAALFFETMIGALKTNLKKANLYDMEAKKIINKVCRRRSVFLRSFISSQTHNDLTVGNIIVDNKKEDVRFIDPRLSLPYSKRANIVGNVAVDLLGYYVSILRKEIELQRKNKNVSLLPIKRRIEKEIAYYEKKGALTPNLKYLCLLFWYSVYCACICNYCLSKKRRWLLKEMKGKISEYFLQIEEICRR